MMRVCRFILIVFFLCYDQTLYANAISVEISSNLSENVTGVLGDNGTQLKCSFTEANVVFSVSLMALNRSSITFETISVFIPDRISRLTLNGLYLKGRVTLTTITQSSMKAAMTFDQLMCIDDTSYKCEVNHLDFDSSFDKVISNSISISVQVPPSKPDRVLIVYTPVDPSLNEIETFSEFQTAKQNNTADYDTTTSGPSNDDFPSDIRHIIEGDNITVVCTGDVGKPPAKHVFEKHLDGKIVPMQYNVTSTSISDMSENCTYYRTSNLTFQVTIKDNNAVIRCVVNSSMAQSDMLYIETAPIEVYYKEAQSTTIRNTANPLSKEKNTGRLLRRHCNDRSADYVNTTQQHNPSLYEGVGQDLDVHNYEQLSRMEHLYNNTNLVT